MTKLKLLLTALILAAVLCGCTPPLIEVQFPANTDGIPSQGSQVNNGVTTRTVYVSGAVETDGYLEIPQICDYKTLLKLAGALPCAKLPADVNAFVPENLEIYVVDYMVDGVTYYSHNVNSLSVKLNLPIDGVDGKVIKKLADYINANGTVSNRNELKTALGDDFADNYYKFYIDGQDYAQDS